MTPRLSPPDAPALHAWPWRLGLAWAAPVLAFGAAAVLGGSRASWRIADYFLAHDLVAAALIAVVVAALALVPLRAVWRVDFNRPRLAVAIAIAAGLAAVIGQRLVMLNYPLSMDEFMARFDAGIFQYGRLYATAPEAWRPFRLPLLPQFNLLAADGASWTSTYLPVNAMVLALFRRLGSEALAGAAWTLLAAAALYGVARRLWPARRDAAVVAVLLMASSSQVLLTAMTPYAMAAHLALNLLWLWLFLDHRPGAQVAAVGVAFLACGLHQVVFHPLFAAPFVLQALMEKRWGKVAFHTLAYALIGLFWLTYWQRVMPAGGAAAAGAAGSGMAIWLSRLEIVTRNFSLDGLAVMAKNLFRFLTWQNPAAVALGVIGAGVALRRGGVLRYATLGLMLMVAAVVFVMPYQGHGWGYRYLHGLIGSLCLLAALGWVRITEAAAETPRRALALGLAALTVVSLLVLLPLRGWQARAFIAPYAEAAAAIVRADADVVVVDTTGLHFGIDLVRNDPWLRNRPKVMDLVWLRPATIRSLCAAHDVAVFDRASGSRIPPIRYARGSLERLAQNRRVMAELGCGQKRVIVP